MRIVATQHMRVLLMGYLALKRIIRPIKLFILFIDSSRLLPFAHELQNNPGCIEISLHWKHVNTKLDAQKMNSAFAGDKWKIYSRLFGDIGDFIGYRFYLRKKRQRNWIPVETVLINRPHHNVQYINYFIWKCWKISILNSLY